MSDMIHLSEEAKQHRATILRERCRQEWLETRPYETIYRTPDSHHRWHNARWESKARLHWAERRLITILMAEALK